MSKLDHEIETLRQEAAQRAITAYYRAVERLSMYDVRVSDVIQMFGKSGSKMRGLEPFRAGPVPPAEQKAHLQRLQDVVRRQTERDLIDDAKTLMDGGFEEGDVIDKLEDALGPNLYAEDEEDDEGSGHETTVFSIGGELVQIDRAILELIEAMNSIDGVETTSCCQGNDGGIGYVEFKGSVAVTFVVAITNEMTKAFAKHGTTVMIDEQEHRHLFFIEISDAFSMRWGPHTYPLVLAAAREAAKRVSVMDKAPSSPGGPKKQRVKRVKGEQA